MARIIERTEACYDVKEAGFGKVYGWRSERLVLECECGERPILTYSATACDGCGTDHLVSFFRGGSHTR